MIPVRHQKRTLSSPLIMVPSKRDGPHGPFIDDARAPVPSWTLDPQELQSLDIRQLLQQVTDFQHLLRDADSEQSSDLELSIPRERYGLNRVLNLGYFFGSCPSAILFNWF